MEHNHPLFHFLNFCKKGPSISELEFSLYNYRPQSLVDEREIVRVSISSFNGIEGFSCKEGWEVSINSRVYFNDGSFSHVPMIDFISRDIGRIERFVRKLTSEYKIDSSILADSGNSFHFYGFSLLSQDEWKNFMGKVLLYGSFVRREIVDNRWIGHRLIAGYSSLRLTNNSGRYKAIPKLYKLIRMSR